MGLFGVLIQRGGFVQIRGVARQNRRLVWRLIGQEVVRRILECRLDLHRQVFGRPVFNLYRDLEPSIRTPLGVLPGNLNVSMRDSGKTAINGYDIGVIPMLDGTRVCMARHGERARGLATPCQGG